MLKKCNECGEEKPHSEFYKHPATKDGYLGQCKTCKKRASRRRRRENIENIREYDRIRSQDVDRRTHLRNNAKHWQTQHPERRKAHNTLNNAIRDGRVTKPDICERCQEYSEIIHGHHKDYNLPLDVEWLCPACHASEISIPF